MERAGRVTLLLALLALGSGRVVRAAEPTIRAVTDPVVHGEGCYWDERTQRLYFVDIAGELVNCYDPATGQVARIHLEGGGVSLVLPVEGSEEALIVTRGHDVLLVRWDGQSTQPQSVRVLASVESDKPGNRFNDGKADPSGRLWLGTMGPEPTPGNVTPDQGALYTMQTNSDDPVPVLGPVSVSNGLCWSRNNRLMYYIDSPTEHVDCFDFNLTSGTIKNRRTVFDFVAHNLTGVPDGMTIDANDNLWVANFNGGKVLHVDPRTGRLLGVLEFPASRVTDCVWGGPRLDTLYVTTSSLGLTAEEMQQQPLAGSVFEVTGLKARGRAGYTAVRSPLPPRRPKSRAHIHHGFRG